MIRKKRFTNLTLIGMPASGKTTIGKKIAKELGYKFIDIDKQIERKFGLKLYQIIDKLGEKQFLREEENKILKLGKINNRVIAPGGSVIYQPKAMKFIKKNSLVIFLDVPFNLIKKQIGNPVRRGVIGAEAKSLKEIYNERLPLYKKYADLTVCFKRH